MEPLPVVERRRYMRTISLATLLLMSIVACGEAEPGAGQIASTTSSSPSTSTSNTTTSGSEGPAAEMIPDGVMNRLLADAENQTGTPAPDITVALARQVTWNDGALGCPEPGVMYTQALVDGYQVVLIAGDEALDYRVDGAGGFRICDQSTGSASDVSVPDPIAPSDAAGVIVAAREELSRLLDRHPDSFVEERVGFVGAAGENPCQPTQLDRRDEESPLLRAFEVVLRSGQATYRYVATGGALHLCQIAAAGGK